MTKDLVRPVFRAALFATLLGVGSAPANACGLSSEPAFARHTLNIIYKSTGKIFAGRVVGSIEHGWVGKRTRVFPRYFLEVFDVEVTDLYKGDLEKRNIKVAYFDKDCVSCHANSRNLHGQYALFVLDNKKYTLLGPDGRPNPALAKYIEKLSAGLSYDYLAYPCQVSIYRFEDRIPKRVSDILREYQDK